MDVTELELEALKLREDPLSVSLSAEAEASCAHRSQAVALSSRTHLTLEDLADLGQTQGCFPRYSWAQALGPWSFKSCSRKTEGLPGWGTVNHQAARLQLKDAKITCMRCDFKRLGIQALLLPSQARSFYKHVTGLI